MLLSRTIFFGYLALRHNIVHGFEGVTGDQRGSLPVRRGCTGPVLCLATPLRRAASST